MNAIHDEPTDEITYKYTISEGISKIQDAILVLKAMDYLEEIIQEIKWSFSIDWKQKWKKPI